MFGESSTCQWRGFESTLWRGPTSTGWQRRINKWPQGLIWEGRAWIYCYSLTQAGSSAETVDEELGNVVWTFRSLKSLFCSRKWLGQYCKASGWQDVEQDSIHWPFVEWLNRAVSGKCTCVAEPVDPWFIRVQSVITAAQSESKGMSNRATVACACVFLSRRVLVL